MNNKWKGHSTSVWLPFWEKESTTLGNLYVANISHCSPCYLSVCLPVMQLFVTVVFLLPAHLLDVPSCHVVSSVDRCCWHHIACTVLRAYLASMLTGAYSGKRFLYCSSWRWFLCFFQLFVYSVCRFAHFLFLQQRCLWDEFIVELIDVMILM